MSKAMITEAQINEIAQQVSFRQIDLDGAGRPASNVYRAVTEVLYQHFGITSKRVDPKRVLTDLVPDSQLDMPIRFAKMRHPIQTRRLNQDGLYPLQKAVGELKFSLLQQLLSLGEQVLGPIEVTVTLTAQVRAVSLQADIAQDISPEEIPRFPYSAVNQ